jgi:transcriptional regulator with XRE-family HTH domain
MLEDSSSELEEMVGRRVKSLRQRSGLSLDALAARSGVSRSMISLIERGETSATAVVLDRLATALDVTLASLFDQPPAGQASPVARFADQPRWRDPASGYERRNVSPAGGDLPFQIVEVRLPAGAHVAYETGPRPDPVPQQVWVLEGNLTLHWGDDRFDLAAGDCLAMALDRPTAFHNPTGQAVHYAVVLAAPGAMRPVRHPA